MREILEAISTMMPMLIGLLGGFFLISGGDERVSGTVFWVFFGIAVSSLAVSIVELVKTLRDLPQKTDTTEMKQKMNAIKAGVDSTNTILLDTVKPALQNVNEQTTKIDNIVTIMSRFDSYDGRYELLERKSIFESGTGPDQSREPAAPRRKSGADAGNSRIKTAPAEPWTDSLISIPSA